MALHVLALRLQALAALCGGLLLAKVRRRLEVLAATRLGQNPFLLNTLRETTQHALEALALRNSYLRQIRPLGTQNWKLARFGQVGTIKFRQVQVVRSSSLL